MAAQRETRVRESYASSANPTRIMTPTRMDSTIIPTLEADPEPTRGWVMAHIIAH